MTSTTRKILIGAIITVVSLFFTITVSAEDLEETVNYQPPTLDQTLDFIQVSPYEVDSLCGVRDARRLLPKESQILLVR